MAHTTRRRSSRLRGPHRTLAPGSYGSRAGAGHLAHYRDTSGRLRELISRRGPGGSVLVMDRDASTYADRRLVAHLGADEPQENAMLMCHRYVQDARRGRCRRVTARDLVADPYANQADARPISVARVPTAELSDARGEMAYRLELAPGRSIRELRWRARSVDAVAAATSRVSLRHVVGALESYEPACELTLESVALYSRSMEVSVATVRSEHARLRTSPIVLNRALREAVLATIERDGVSMSEIALRCGRVKRDCKGRASGETSWLARRIGLVAESGAVRATPWIHSDVLGLIARAGLGVSPREVELE